MAKTPAKAPAKPAAKAAPKSASKPAAKPAAKAAAKPIAKPTPKPAAKPPVKPALAAAQKVIADTIAKPNTQDASGDKLAIDSLEPLSYAPAQVRGYPDGYTPNDNEPYMSKKQLCYFRDLLLGWRKELEAGNLSTMHDLKENSTIEADMTDQATLEYEQTLELRNRDRARKLISKIDEAIDRIRQGEFGYCQETGDPIGIGRLLARPIATLSIEAKRRQEKKEVSYAG